jgi:23S rRNA (guanosine2251-2'-O)-methyltransferase
MTANTNFSGDDKLVIYGRQPVLEALRSGAKIQRLWMVRESTGPGIGLIKKLAENRKVEIEMVMHDSIQRHVGSVVHQGVAASVQAQFFAPDSELPALLSGDGPVLIVVLDQVQDTHNLGAILRTAEIAGVTLVAFHEKGSAPINATTVKTSAGAIFNSRLYRIADYESFFNQLRSAGVRILATMPANGAELYRTDLSGRIAIMIGNEGYGVRKNLLPYCDQTVVIPQYGKTNSLNASVSLAIVLYEAIRQRNF